ncbi:M48 family metalloprotease [Dactylosporangium sp. NPDC051541]|uniref:M56 family metallopeptidase n=1 Tax=Dactylosporangium sp. NPDC051541 TaxID=3363977 RepID=UPI0037A1E646
MTWLVHAPAAMLMLLLPALLWPLARLAARVGRPERAARALAAGSLATGVSGLVCLLLVAATLVDDLPAVERYAHLSTADGRHLPEPVPDPLAITAALLLLWIGARLATGLHRRRTVTRTLHGTGRTEDASHIAGRGGDALYVAGPAGDALHVAGPAGDALHVAGPAGDALHVAGPAEDALHVAGRAEDALHNTGPAEDAPHNAGPAEDVRHGAWPGDVGEHSVGPGEGGLRGMRRGDAGWGDDGLVVADWDSPRAVAVPPGRGRRGHVLVTSGLLRLLDARERAAVLAHERAHLRYNHHRTTAVAAVATAINPLLRPVESAVCLLVERSADEDAARTVADRRLVAHTIAKVALAAHGSEFASSSEFARGSHVARGPDVAHSIAKVALAAHGSECASSSDLARGSDVAHGPDVAHSIAKVALAAHGSECASSSDFARGSDLARGSDGLPASDVACGSEGGRGAGGVHGGPEGVPGSPDVLGFGGSSTVRRVEALVRPDRGRARDFTVSGAAGVGVLSVTVAGLAVLEFVALLQAWLPAG